jgi:hypothetical protein
MKINILTDVSGRILATHYRSTVPAVTSSAAPTTSRIKPLAGQSVHEVELPLELEASLIKSSLGKDLTSWKIHHEGKAARLVKIS